MRTTATFPKCSGKKIVVTELRHIRSPDGLHEFAHALPVVVVQAKKASTNTRGVFESWICASCGFTEFYAKDLGDVDRLAAERPADVRIVDGTVQKKGPFR